MENTAKALLIAGGMMLAILILSVFAYISFKTAGTTSKIYENLEESDITEFNQQFFNFQEKAELTMQDVISVANLAKNNNEKRKMPTIVTVSVTGNGWKELNVEKKKTSELEVLLKKHFYETFAYCEVQYANNSKLIGKVIIKTKK